MAETEFSEVRFGGNRDRAKQVYAGVRPLAAEDVADAVHWCVTRPPHVNVNVVELMPVAQAFSAFAIDRRR
jgi:3-hydroxy acid dehydrogenase/malonic semialdehyde reductase